MRLLGSRQPAGGPQDSPQEEDGWEAQVGGLAVVRKAMYALSALLCANLALALALAPTLPRRCPSPWPWPLTQTFAEWP